MPFGVRSLVRLMMSAAQPKHTENWLHSGHLPMTTVLETWPSKSPLNGFLAIHQQRSRQVRTFSTKSDTYLPAWVPREWFNPITRMAWNVTRRSWRKTTVITRSGQILWKLGVWCRTSLNTYTKVYQTPLRPFNENILCLWSRKRNRGAPLLVLLGRSDFTFIPLAIILVNCFISISAEGSRSFFISSGMHEENLNKMKHS